MVPVIDGNIARREPLLELVTSCTEVSRQPTLHRTPQEPTGWTRLTSRITLAARDGRRRRSSSHAGCVDVVSVEPERRWTGTDVHLLAVQDSGQRQRHRA